MQYEKRRMKTKQTWLPLGWLTLGITPKEQIDIGEDIILRFRWNSNKHQTKILIQAPKEMKILRVKLAALGTMKTKGL